MRCELRYVTCGYLSWRNSKKSNRNDYKSGGANKVALTFVQFVNELSVESFELQINF